MSFVSDLRVPPMIAMLNYTTIPGGVISDEAVEQVANGRRLC